MATEVASGPGVATDDVVVGPAIDAGADVEDIAAVVVAGDGAALVAEAEGEAPGGHDMPIPCMTRSGGNKAPPVGRRGRECRAR